MRYRRKSSRFVVSSSVALSALISVTAAQAAPSAKPAGPPPTLTDLGVMENRFFSHPYSQDPVDKRIERLECMVFGGVQAGTNEERLARIIKVVAERSQKPVDKKTTVEETAKNDPPQSQTEPKHDSASGGNASAQYPVLNTLEWRALKKTYNTESLDQRLDRLESKMFGQPAQSMAYADRIERLRKTLGIGIDTGLDNSLANRGIGPAPRARARENNNELGLQPSWPSNGMPRMPGMSGMPGISGMNGMNDFGFSFGVPGGGDSIFGATFDKQLHQMMDQMNKQMAEAQRLGPGSWRFDPKTNLWVDIDSGRKVAPNQGGPRIAPGPRSYPLPPLVAPQRRPNGVIDEVPAYADPNSI